ncbi:hypothetical protein [Micromonospora lupini]|uniref:hypothetical protein n=1 Tax=Micromonospora lupini TaxID=285679 RepID=UPI0031D689F1
MATLSLTGAGLLAGPATAAPTAEPSARPTLTTEQPRPATVPPAAAPGTPATSAPSRATEPKAKVGSTSATCGGGLPLGQVKNCASITGTAQHTWTVTSTVDQDTLFVRLRQVSGDGVSATVKGPDGSNVCYVSSYLTDCKLGAAGVYTITVALYYGTGKGAYSLSAESMRAPSTCVSLPASFFSFASAGRSGTLPAGLAARCFTFKQPTGAVLHLAGTGGVQGDILDAQFQRICSVGYPTECTLREPGPYRLFLEETYGNKAAYTLRMPRISQSVGCPALPLTAFGDPGAAVGTGTAPPNQEISCQSLRVTTPGRLVIRLDQYANQYLDWRLYDDAGQVVCTEYDSARSCAAPTAGAYTLVSQNWNWEPVSYRAAVVRLDQAEGCAAPTTLNWDQPALTVHQTSPVQTNCQPFHGEAGERVMVYRAPDRYNEVASWIVDEQGGVVCAEWSEQDGCALPSTGTYRVVSYLMNWAADSEDLTYKVQVRRLSDAVGCPTITPGTYNSAPAGALGGIRCRTLDLPSAGTYRVTAVSAENYRSYATVYDSAGVKVCTDTWCKIPAAGKYTMVLSGGAPNEVIDTDFLYAVALLPWKPSDCTPVSDTGWQDAPHRGRFDAAGQHNCLQLPSPTGAHVAELLPGDVTAETSPEIIVVNAAGDQVCDYSSLRQYSCELTGEAPFSVLLTADEGFPTASYAVAFARTDGPPACPVLPGDASGATVTTGADHFAVCYTVPGDQHASRESFTWTRTAGSGDARLSVFDSQGIRYCGPTGPAVERTVTCTLPAGPVTVILETDAVDASYRLTHRDGTAPTA